MRRSWQAGFVVVALSVVGCGGGDEDEPSCGTADSPLVLGVRDVQPAAGSSVANQDIVHRYTIVGVDALFQPELGLPPAHTAGQPMPLELTITPIVLEGSDVLYEITPLAWSNAPAHVQIVDPSVYRTDEGCYYAFPSPLYDYDVTAP